ncbi:hypothetical protein I917_22985 [Mycobacterium tuberculosis str. Haarlem/NITR202]|uniref:Formyl-CoA transferase n=1 Tax=Mycobacterium tuberculosis str. Haarlem/NITR202 TaxID=1304279 RepID=R4M277_MYCTX|nr:hypothetical protein I917_22985 [Mycobacterium tuberculosis str. Haarlem/NITR202]
MAGPLAGQVLVDLGAEVIKVEAPGGEAARQITSVLPGRPPLATYFLPNNRGKKSVTVDLTTEQAQAADAAARGHRRRCLGGVSARHHGKAGPRP